MTKEDIKTRLINNDALFKNIYVVEQQFDIVPEDRKHYGAAVSYQDIMELRSDFLEQLIDTVVDWVYSSEKYADLKAKFIESGKSEGAAASQVVRKAKEKFRRGDDKLLIQGQLGELLLFHFIQRFKGAVPLLRKMSITTSAEHERYGADAIHYKIENGKNVIVLGEAKAWAIEVPLSEFFKDEFYSAGDIQLKIEDKIQMLQKTASFDIPLLIKPVVEMKNPASTIVSSLQAGAYKKTTKKMIDIGIPRELAIRLNSMLKESRNSEKLDNYDYEQWVRKSVLKIKPTLSYWEQAQLEFLGD